MYWLADVLFAPTYIHVYGYSVSSLCPSGPPAAQWLRLWCLLDQIRGVLVTRLLRSASKQAVTVGSFLHPSSTRISSTGDSGGVDVCVYTYMFVESRRVKELPCVPSSTSKLIQLLPLIFVDFVTHRLEARWPEERSRLKELRKKHREKARKERLRAIRIGNSTLPPKASPKACC